MHNKQIMTLPELNVFQVQVAQYVFNTSRVNFFKEKKNPFKHGNLTADLET